MVSANCTQIGILRLHAAIARQDGAAGAHDLRQMVVRLSHGRVAEELRDGGQARRRARVEEGGAGRACAGSCPPPWPSTPLMVRKSHRMRMPRSDAEQWRAMEATSPGPSPTARNTSRSMAARSAAVRWCACSVSKTSAGFGATAVAIDGKTDLPFFSATCCFARNTHFRTQVDSTIHRLGRARIAVESR